MNRVTLIGHLGQKPESRAAGSGTVCKFSIATNDGTKETPRTTWHNCEAWGKQGEVIQRYFDKGSPIVIEGAYLTQHWEDKEGNKRTSYFVSVKRFEFPPKSQQPSGGHENVPMSETAGDLPF